MTEITFGDLVDLGNIEKVKMSNNSGTFYLTANQLKRLKIDLENIKFNPKISAKVGAIIIDLSTNGKIHHLSTSTNGYYLEIHKKSVTKNIKSIGDLEWLYFNIGDVNFDNYK